MNVLDAGLGGPDQRTVSKELQIKARVRWMPNHTWLVMPAGWGRNHTRKPRPMERPRDFMSAPQVNGGSALAAGAAAAAADTSRGSAARVCGGEGRRVVCARDG